MEAAQPLRWSTCLENERERKNRTKRFLEFSIQEHADEIWLGSLLVLELVLQLEEWEGWEEENTSFRVRSGKNLLIREKSVPH